MAEKQCLEGWFARIPYYASDWYIFIPGTWYQLLAARPVIGHTWPVFGHFHKI